MRIALCVEGRRGSVKGVEPDSMLCLLSCSAFAIVAGTLHHGSLWGCPLVCSTTIAPCGATELTSFAQVSSAQAGSGTACHVTMCPFAFTVDDSHTEATSKLEMYAHIDQIFIYNFSKAIGSQMALS